MYMSFIGEQDKISSGKVRNKKNKMTRTYNKTFYTYTHINIQSTYGQITTDPEKRKKKGQQSRKLVVSTFTPSF